MEKIIETFNRTGITARTEDWSVIVGRSSENDRPFISVGDREISLSIEEFKAVAECLNALLSSAPEKF